MTSDLPWVVVDGDGDGAEVEWIAAFLRDLHLSDMSPLTLRSYGFDLLRWWRLLTLLAISWDRATRADVETLVGWMRNSRNSQRDRGPNTTTTAGSVNLRTGKPLLRMGYASSTINHALTVVSAFYAFHAHFGRGPVTNPVPADRRRQLLAHHNPIDVLPAYRRGPLRQKTAQRRPQPIPDLMWDELFAVMGCYRDRALLAFYVSSGARASELLGLRAEHVDWARQQIWVVSKGSRILEPVPGSPEAFATTPGAGPQPRVSRCGAPVDAIGGR